MKSFRVFARRVQWSALFVLALVGAITVAQLAHELGADLHFEPGRRRSATLTDETRTRLASYHEEVRLTYFVTRREELPAHLAHLEDSVRDVFAAFEAATAATGKPFGVAIVYPDDHPDWAPAIASAGVATWRARRVEGDGYRDDQLWSSLRIGYGAKPAAVFNGVGPEHVAQLQRLILAQLDQLRTPRRPKVAISAPAGFDGLRAILASGADVTELDFENNATLPGDTDIFFWLEPERVGEAQLAALEGLRARGGSLVFAGHHLRSTETWTGDKLEVAFAAGSRASQTVLSHFGLEPFDGLLLDPRGALLVGPAEGDAEPPSKIAPWWVRSTPNNQDFRTLRGQPNGGLLFATPEAFTPDPLRLSELGLEATVLAGASELATSLTPPTSALTVEQVFELEGQPEPHAALCAILRPQDPWSGRLVMLADAAPFGDAYLRHEDYAHVQLLEILLTQLTSDQRMVASRIALESSEVLPELAAMQRALLRFLVVLLIPSLLVVVSIARNRGHGQSATRFAPYVRAFVPTALGTALLLVANAFAPEFDADLTRDGKNRLTPSEVETFRSLLTEPLEIEVCFSSPGRLPPEFKAALREVQRTCESLERYFDDVTIATLRPDDLAVEERAELARSGIAPFALSTSTAEGARLFRIFAHLRMRAGEREEVLTFASVRSFGDLRFRLAHALQRLQSGQPARVALFAEPPRLSPAEANLEYQRKGLFTPREGDVFSEFANLLAEFDFKVARLDPRKDAIPLDAQAVLWMQPRRDVLPMLEQLAGHLSAGGSALVAGQHFRILSRQLQGAGLDARFWPEPQFLDLELHYLPELGISMPREVLFDAQHGSMELSTRIDDVSGQPTYSNLQTTQPFLVKSATTAGQSALPPGEFLLPFPTRLQLNEGELERRGLQVSPWLRGSKQSWSYAWQGGDLAPNVLVGTVDEGEPAPVPLDASPLYAAMFEGKFPAAVLVAQSSESGARSQQQKLELMEAAPSTQNGRLLLIGDAEVFKSATLTLENYDHELLALRAAATLALPPNLVALLRREKGSPPLEPQSDSSRLFWRLIVLGAFPLALLLLAGLRRISA